MSNITKQLLNGVAPFVPHPLLPGGDLQTLAGYYLPGPKRLSGTKTHQLTCPDGDRLVLCENAGSRKSLVSKSVLFIHGLGGHAGSPYMLRIGKLFQQRGWTVFRMNHRGCGEGRGLARKTYHSGKSDDISLVLRKMTCLYQRQPIVAVGFSLSGNALLKLLGEQQDVIPEQLAGGIAVAPPIDLSKCAAQIHAVRNRLYEHRFTKMLRDAVVERRHQFNDFPDFSLPPKMSIRDFDEICTAPLHGFRSAEEYYGRCSARQFLPGLSLPTVVLGAADDPFIPSNTFEGLPRNGRLACYVTRSGGHMGYVSARSTPPGSHRWGDYALLTFSESMLRLR